MNGQGGRRRRIRASLAAAALLLLAAAPLARGADRVYWANGNNNTISYASLDGSGGGGQLNLSGTTPNRPRGVAIDAATRRLYWANEGDNTILYANLDGSGGGHLDVGTAPIVSPHAVAIDPTTRTIYWANDSGNPISYAKLDGSGGAALDTSGSTPDNPYGAAIDLAGGRIYWANRGIPAMPDTHPSTISYANLDGSGGGGQLDVGTAPIFDAHGATIDPEAGRIYWANNMPSAPIAYANLDGSGGAKLDVSGASPSGPVGMAIDPAAGLIYMGNLGTSKITFADLHGSGSGGTLDITGATSSGSRFLALDRAPNGISAPAISGESAVGSVLSCSQGAWASDLPGAFLYRAPEAFAYQWIRDDADIAGATAGLYTVFAPGDYRCRVTASNHVGDTSQTSAPDTVTVPGGSDGGGSGGGGSVVGPAGGVAGSGAGAAGGVAGTTTFPPAAASFAGSKSLITVTRGGGFTFIFHAAGKLTGRATFDSIGKVRVSRRSKGRKRLALARRSFTVLPSGRVTLRIFLSRANFRILTLDRKIPIRVAVILRNAAGLTRVASWRITLMAPKPGHH
jgi:DNA-binding beta-propeller fold protein YncE